VVKIHEGILLNEAVTYTLSQLSEVCEAEESILLEMIEHGIIEPKGEGRETWVFASYKLGRYRKAIRLHQDLGINWEGIIVVLELLEEVHDLRQWLALYQKS
jgi:chaperone modulatory protein CbpM